MMTHKYSRFYLLSLVVACMLLAACNAPPPPQPLNLPVTLGFIDNGNELHIALSTTEYYGGGGAIAYAAGVPDEPGEAIEIELLGVQPCPTQYPPWPVRGCPAADMQATAEISLDGLPQVGAFPLFLTAGDHTEELELSIDAGTIRLHHATDSQIITPQPEASYIVDEDSHFWQRIQDLESPVTLDFVDDEHGLRMTLTIAPVRGGGTLAYTTNLPTVPGDEMRIQIHGLRPCMFACLEAELVVREEIALDDVPHGEYSLGVATDFAQDDLLLRLDDYIVHLRPDTDNGVVMPNPDAAYVPDRNNRGDGLYQWRRLQPDTVWVVISYSGLVGGSHPTAREQAQYWEQVAAVQEGLEAGGDLESLGLIEARYAHPNFVSLWPRYPMPFHLQAAHEVIPVQVMYYRHTGNWDELVARLESLTYSGPAYVTVYSFHGDVRGLTRSVNAVQPVSPVSPLQ